MAPAERGDKTQLIALSLASRDRRPRSVLGGILVAALAHALAASFAFGLMAIAAILGLF